MSYRTILRAHGCLLGTALLVMAARPMISAAQDPGAAKNPAASKAAPETKAKADAEIDPFAVPNGTPEELLKYIEKLKTAEPSATSRDMLVKFRKQQITALLTAAEKILAAKPTKDQGREAVQYKVVALRMLDRLGDAEAEKKLQKFPDELDKAGQKELARDARGALLEIRLEDADEKAQVVKLAEEAIRFLGDGEIDAGSAGLAQHVAMAIESVEEGEAAVRLYGDLGKLLAKSKDPKIARMAAMMEGAARRLGLVGKPFTLEGTTVAGKPLDWKKYKGHVVLVDFFATWCGPCRAEIPNIVRNYDAYHARGFDVVTVSLDEDRKALDDFLEHEKHPWTVLLDKTEVRGTDKSMATYYGIMGIPQMILVGKDGNVVDLNARGEKLGEELEKMLGPAEENSGDKKPKAEKKKRNDE